VSSPDTLAAPTTLATRTLPELLRRELAQPAGIRLVAGKVISAPDGQHVAVDVGGSTVTVPRLKSYASPTANAVAYLLASGSMLLAIGEI